MERAFEYDGLGALFPVDESSLWVLHTSLKSKGSGQRCRPLLAGRAVGCVVTG